MNNGDIWLLNLNPTIGAEIHKTCPAIIVNCDSIGILPLKIIVPITDWKSQYSQVPWMVKVIPNNENLLDKLLTPFKSVQCHKNCLLDTLGKWI